MAETRLGSAVSEEKLRIFGKENFCWKFLRIYVQTPRSLRTRMAII